MFSILSSKHSIIISTVYPSPKRTLNFTNTVTIHKSTYYSKRSKVIKVQTAIKYIYIGYEDSTSTNYPGTVTTINIFTLSSNSESMFA